MRLLPSLTVAATVMTLSLAAQAQIYGGITLGEKGQLTFAAERLFGFQWVSSDVDGPGAPGDGSSTMIGFGWWYAQHPPVNQPRLGVDYFVIDRLSIGGSLGFFSGNVDGGLGPIDDAGFLFAPRVGYAIDLGSWASFWPRGGITYVNYPDDTYGLGFSAEGAFALFPKPAWAVLLAPALDLMPMGELGNDRDVSAFAFAINAGLLVTL